ncbi:Lrp/AsnC family transcriptional regulator [[Eubacterium] cellulosolvens]
MYRKIGFRPIVGACVLVAIEPGFLQEVARQLAEIEDVHDVLEIHGEYEVLLRVYCDSTEKLRSTLTEKIRVLTGVKGTTVFYIFKSWKGTCE